MINILLKRLYLSRTIIHFLYKHIISIKNNCIDKLIDDDNKYIKL